jgi:hypothetical protein
LDGLRPTAGFRPGNPLIVRVQKNILYKYIIQLHCSITYIYKMDFTPENTNQYCRIRADIKSGRLRPPSGIHPDPETDRGTSPWEALPSTASRSANSNQTYAQEVYNTEYSRCLEKYYVRCLKDVFEHNRFVKDSENTKSIVVCESIIDFYQKP